MQKGESVMSLAEWIIIVRVVVEILRTILDDDNGLAEDIINLGKKTGKESISDVS